MAKNSCRLDGSLRILVNLPGAALAARAALLTPVYGTLAASRLCTGDGPAGGCARGFAASLAPVYKTLAASRL